MIDLLNFIFQSFWHFIGFIFLLLVTGGVVANIIKSFKLFEINKSPQIPQIPQTQFNSNVFNDLVKLWNNRNKGEDDKNQK